MLPRFTRRDFLTGATAAAVAPVGGQLPPNEDHAGPKVGMFYTCWWTEADIGGFWLRLRGPGNQTPALGHYGCGETKIIRVHYERMRECGIDFVIFDDTNGIFNLDRAIDRNIRAWFDFMDELPPEKRILLCIAFRGDHGADEERNRRSHQESADYLYKTYARRPGYFRIAGKPLALWYIEDEPFPEWQDDRWTIRRCYHFFHTDKQPQHGGWGWGSKPYPPDNKECMSFFPGWSFGDNPAIDRRGGDYFMECWLRVVKAKPRYVAIADWNQWHEKCAVEDCTDWVDHDGYSTPDWYRQIIQGYVAMCRGAVLHGWYYREENTPNVYLFDGRKLIHQPAYPHRRPTLLTPKGWLDQFPKPA